MGEIIYRLKPVLRKTLKRSIKSCLILPRITTSRFRILPDFIIIGAQKCGTTSLYRNLIKHPNIAPAFRKEVRYFDIKFYRSNSWYKAHFPTVFYKYYIEKIRGHKLMTGEASPDYMVHPHCPERIAKLLPNVKLIVMFRNPVDRTYSHYNHTKRHGYEQLSFEDAIQSETERLSGEMDKMLENPNYFNFNYFRLSYLLRGIYVDQLKRWMSFFPKEQFLIIKSEDFFANPSETLQHVYHFLNVPDWEIKNFRIYNSRNYPQLDPVLRKKLIEYFKPHNQRLYDYLGVDFGWEQEIIIS